MNEVGRGTDSTFIHPEVTIVFLSCLPRTFLSLAMLALTICSICLAEEKKPDAGKGTKSLRDQTSEEKEQLAEEIRAQRKLPLKYRIGGPPPALQVSRWSDGKPHTLADFAGKVVVLEFTASWCAPCRANAEVMKKLAAKYKDDVVFVGVSAADVTDEELKLWIEQDQWPPYLAVDAADEQNALGKTAKGYGVLMVPSLVVIDRRGNISYSDEILARHPLTDEQTQKQYAEASRVLGRKWPPADIEDIEKIPPKEMEEIRQKLLELRVSWLIDEGLSRTDIGKRKNK